MAAVCVHCGFDAAAGPTCRDLFDRCLALEFEHPATFGAVHHLTVLCFQLQHNAYSRDAWLEARSMLDHFIHRGGAPDDIRRHAARTRPARKNGSITRGPKLAGIEMIEWSLSIASVRMGRAAEYQADVHAWAKAVLADSGPTAAGQ